MIDGYANARNEIVLCDMCVWCDRSGGYIGITSFGFGNLTGGAQRRFASLGGRMFGLNAWITDGRFGRRGIESARMHQFLYVLEAEMTKTGVPEE